MPPPRVVALGIGCAGSNAVSQLIGTDVQGVSFVAINTDAQALARAQAPTRILIGETLTRGLGAGVTPDIDENAAVESVEQIAYLVRDADFVFLAAFRDRRTGP